MHPSRAGASFLPAAALLAALVEERGVESSRVLGAFNAERVLRFSLRDQRPCRPRLFGAGREDSHSLPVIGKISPAIKANYVGAGEGHRFAASGAGTLTHRKGVMSVPTAEDCIK